VDRSLDSHRHTWRRRGDDLAKLVERDAMRRARRCEGQLARQADAVEGANRGVTREVGLYS
jgi:hypothetical protein